MVGSGCYFGGKNSEQKHLYGTYGYTVTRTERGAQKLANKDLLELYLGIQLEWKIPTQLGQANYIRIRTSTTTRNVVIYDENFMTF